MRDGAAPDGRQTAAFEVVDLPTDQLVRLKHVDWDATRWNALLAVYVARDTDATASKSPDSAAIADRPAVLGTHRIVDGALRFEPQYPLQPGLAYDVVFHASQLPRQDAAEADGTSPGVPLVQRFSLNRPAGEAAAVEQVYPTTDRLPENQLKFYIHFSAPMSRGEAYRRVHLLDSAGKEIRFAFLELDEELWDPSGERFTLFFDPGRVKRELVPHMEMGRALVEGRDYTLVVDKEWLDASARPLREPFRKPFRVVAPDEQPPTVDSWKVTTPAAGTRAPLAVSFPEPLDHALLLRQLWIENQRGDVVRGTSQTANSETGWQFTPEADWPAGSYRLMVDTTLEDLAGNNIGRPFEVDVFHPVQRRVEAKTVAVPFEVRSAGNGQ